MRSSARGRALFELTRARFLGFWRQPGTLFWVFGFPVVMAVVLGLAFRTRPPEAIPIGVVESGPGVERLVEALEGDERVRVIAAPEISAREDLRTGRVDVVVMSLPDGTVRYLFDPTRPTGRTARALADDVLQRASGRADVVATVDEEVAEPGARYIDFLIPGLIGLNLMGSSMWGSGFWIVMARVRKLLKRLAATPMRRLDFMFAMVLSRLVFLGFELTFLVAFGWLAFGVAVRGSIISLVVVAVIGTAAFTGLALLTASRADSIEVASGFMNLAMIPMWLFSGSFFSYERFPEWLHPLVKALPLTALNDALRAIMNDGASLASQWSELGVLIVWCVGATALALKMFRWQ